MSKYGVFSGPYVPVFGLNTEIYLNLRIQSEYRKMRTKKISVFGHFSRRGTVFTQRHCLHAEAESFTFFRTDNNYGNIKLKSSTTVVLVMTCLGVQFNIIYFFYQRFPSQTLTVHRTTREGKGPSFIPLYHFHPITNNEAFVCNFACEMTITYNRNACVYQTATR